MNFEAPRVLALSSDRNVLRDLSRFLAVFGYDLRQVADPSQLETALEGSRAQFLLIDGEGALDAAEITRRIIQPDRRVPVYILHLVSHPTARSLTEALESGADDFLAKPLVYGELLARIRSGARVVEYERRVREQALVEPLTGCISRTAFHDRLRFEVETPARHRLQSCCVLIDIDFLENINAQRGWPAGDSVIVATAKEIEKAAPEDAIVASFGAGRFATFLPGHDLQQARQWTDRIRQDIELNTVVVADEPLRISISAGVVPVTKSAGAADTPEDIVARLLETLKSAKQSGRNFTAGEDEFNDEEQVWAAQATGGKVFDTTVARDVMTPCTVMVHADTCIGAASRILVQTGLAEIPVVDNGGNVVGVVPGDELLDNNTSTRDMANPLADLMLEVSTLPEDTGFGDLMQFFADNPDPLVVIVRGKQPLGLVHRKHLAALSEPVRLETLRSTADFSTSSDYLVVSSVDDTWFCVKAIDNK